MSQETWTAVDRYMEDALLGSDPVMHAVLAANAEAGLPSIDVAPNQGKLLCLLARMQGAQRILEIGTLGGYSTLWLARALGPQGKVVTLEVAARHAEAARANFERASVSGKIELRLGPAAASLAQLVAEGAAPFDMVFIDADKPSNPLYLDWALRLSRPGTLIVCDNVVREGAVIDAASPDASVQGVRRFVEMLAADPRLDATAVQTVGSKGHDGFILLLVK
jgi:predicted O-methyltransferase YrrM